MQNFIPISRKIFDHRFWKENRTYSRFEAWLDILKSASLHDNNSRLINGREITWNRGEWPVSIRFLCSRWKWSNSKVISFLKSLENNVMITQKKATANTLITICKYDSYNIRSDGEATLKRRRGDKVKERKEYYIYNAREKIIDFEGWFEREYSLRLPVLQMQLKTPFDVAAEKFIQEKCEDVFESREHVKNSFVNFWRSLKPEKPKMEISKTLTPSQKAARVI